MDAFDAVQLALSDKIEEDVSKNKKSTLKKKSFNAIQSDSSEDESTKTNENGSDETLNVFDFVQSDLSAKIKLGVTQSRKKKSSGKKFQVIQPDPAEDEADPEMKKTDQKEASSSKSTEKNKSFTKKKKLLVMSDSEDSDA